MTLWWNRLKRIVASEADDAKDEFEKLRDVVDKELTRKEREMAAGPSERLDMILEDIEADQDRLAVIGEELGTGNAESEPEADRREVNETEPPGAADGRPAPRRARLLGPADVSTAPHFDTALRWVAVEPLSPDQRTGALADFDHYVRLEEWVGRLIGEERFAELEGLVEAYPLVLEAVQEDREVLFVKAPGLHAEDVRLIVAAAFANYVPDDWKELLGE